MIRNCDTCKINNIDDWELIMNRRLSTTIPDIRRNIILTKEEHNKYTKEKEYLEPGQEVFIRDLDKTGEIEKREMNERSYGISILIRILINNL